MELLTLNMTSPYSVDLCYTLPTVTFTNDFHLQLILKVCRAGYYVEIFCLFLTIRFNKYIGYRL